MTHPLPPDTPAPPFSLRATPDQTLTLADFQGRPVVLAFYPADWSPVCGDQMTMYNELLPEFEGFGAALLGISVDGPWCHLAFARDRKFRFPLLADFEPKGAVSRAYQAYDDKAGTSEPGSVRHRRQWHHSLELRLAFWDQSWRADGILRALEALPHESPQ
jgi:peroxiredoxin